MKKVALIEQANLCSPDFANFDSVDLDSRLKELRAAYTAALARSTEKTINVMLTNRQYECYVLYYKHDLTEREISQCLNISVSTVSRHLKAARKKFLQLENYCDVLRC